MPFLPYIPTANCAEAVFQGVWASQQAFFTLSFRKDSPWLLTDLDDLGTQLSGWWDDDLSGHISNAFTLSTIKLTSLESDTAPTTFSTAFTQTTGQVAEVSVPNSVACVVSFRTALRGRSYRGRTYLPAAPRSYLDSSTTFGTTAVTNFGADYDALSVLMTANAWDHVVISRYNAGVRRTTGVATKVLTYLVRTKIGTMTSRIVGNGS